VYFKDLKKKDVVVEYQLLRDGPTQSGTAFPNFYVWVTVKENGTLLEDGAVRVAAMEKKRFGVYDYFSARRYRRDMDKILSNLSPACGNQIKEKIGK